MLRWIHREVLSLCIMALFLVRFAIVFMVRPVVHIVILMGNLIADILAIGYMLAVPDLA